MLDTDDILDGKLSPSGTIVGTMFSEKGDPGEPGPEGPQGFSPIITTSKQGKITTLTITDATGTHSTEILDGMDGQGSGNMNTLVYDTNENGIVDNAEKVNNHTVEKDVPSNAIFSDTTYTAGIGIEITGENVINNTQINETEIAIQSTEPTGNEKIWINPDEPINNMEYKYNNQWEKIVVSSNVPVGTIIVWPSNTIPNGWMLCDGRELLRTGYPTLFNRIGTEFGSGDNLTTFNLPDCRGKVSVGKSSDTEFNTIGKTGGEKTHTLTIDEMPRHSHNLYTIQPNSPSGWGLQYYFKEDGTGPNDNTDRTVEVGNSQPHNNLQPYIVVNFIIKVINEETAESTVDSLPIGSILDYAGNTVPEGFSKVADDYTEYSTTEQVIGKWIDGKPLYRKVLNFNITSHYHTILAPTNIDTLITLKGMYTAGAYPIPYATTTAPDYVIEAYYTSGAIGIKTGENITLNEPVILIVEYTKTTD